MGRFINHSVLFACISSANTPGRYDLLAQNPVSSSIVPSTAFTYRRVFYVSPTGNDINSGTSRLLSWKTAAKVGSSTFTAGDTILFEAGETFTGPVYLGPDDTGTGADPILGSSYGEGRAVFDGGSADHGFLAYNTAGIEIANVEVLGAGAAVNPNAGIFFYSDLPGDVKLNYVRILDIEASGFRNGVIIGSWNNQSGFDDVLMSDVVAHHNSDNGIITYGETNYAHTHVHIEGSTAYQNSGVGASRGVAWC